MISYRQTRTLATPARTPKSLVKTPQNANCIVESEEFYEMLIRKSWFKSSQQQIIGHIGRAFATRHQVSPGCQEVLSDVLQTVSPTNEDAMILKFGRVLGSSSLSVTVSLWTYRYRLFKPHKNKITLTVLTRHLWSQTEMIFPNTQLTPNPHSIQNSEQQTRKITTEYTFSGRNTSLLLMIQRRNT
ncbi:hypothetical protein ABKN59_006783 [Abortiporus biennis]